MRNKPVITIAGTFTTLLLMLLSTLPGTVAAAVQLGVSSRPAWVAWYIAERNGYFERHGVRVELLWFDRYQDSIDALVKGRLDANSQSWGDTLALLAGGEPLQLILLNDSSPFDDMLISRNGVTAIEQLRGKRIAMELEGLSRLLLETALNSHGVALDEVERVQMPGENIADALARGEVDAAVGTGSWVQELLRQGKTRLLFDASHIPRLLTSGVVTHSERLRDGTKRNELIAMMRAWFDTVAFIREQPEQAAQIMAEVNNLQGSEYLPLLPVIHFYDAQSNRRALGNAARSSEIAPTTRRVLEYLSRHRELNHSLDIRQAINTRLLDTALSR